MTAVNLKHLTLGYFRQKYTNRQNTVLCWKWKYGVPASSNLSNIMNSIKLPVVTFTVVERIRLPVCTECTPEIHSYRPDYITMSSHYLQPLPCYISTKDLFIFQAGQYHWPSIGNLTKNKIAYNSKQCRPILISTGCKAQDKSRKYNILPIND